MRRLVRRWSIKRLDLLPLQVRPTLLHIGLTSPQLSSRKALCGYSLQQQGLLRKAPRNISVMGTYLEAHFSRAFRCTFGRSPHAFLIRWRIELAAQYMLQTEAPLSEIAIRCGFLDQAHLCHQFRRIAGHSPAAWRRAHRREDDIDGHGDALRFLLAPRPTTPLSRPTTPLFRCLG